MQLCLTAEDLPSSVNLTLMTPGYIPACMYLEMHPCTLKGQNGLKETKEKRRDPQHLNGTSILILLIS